MHALRPAPQGIVLTWILMVRLSIIIILTDFICIINSLFTNVLSFDCAFNILRYRECYSCWSCIKFLIVLHFYFANIKNNAQAMCSEKSLD